MLLQLAQRFIVERVAPRVRDDEQGQGMVEYALILTLIALACITAFTTLGGTIATTVGNITSSL